MEREFWQLVSGLPQRQKGRESHGQIVWEALIMMFSFLETEKLYGHIGTL